MDYMAPNFMIQANEIVTQQFLLKAQL